jgi:predicted O-methyltransferase YrrM
LALAGRLAALPFVPTRARRHRLYYAHELLRPSLPLVTLESILQDDLSDAAEVRLKAIRYQEHNCSVFELFVLGLLARTLKATCCFEFGTYDGRSALALACNLAGDGLVYTLNLPPDYLDNLPEGKCSFDAQLSRKVRSGCRWEGHPEASRIRQLFGDSRTFDCSPYGPAQLIFIDAAHDEVSVASDSHKALQLVDRSNGTILWHDATHYGVEKYLPRLAAEGHPIYVILGTDLAVLRFHNGQALSWARP